MKYPILILMIIITTANLGIAQTDSLKTLKGCDNDFLKRQILPISLITTGSLLNIGAIKMDIQNKIPNTNTQIEDYFQYAPMAQIYLYDIFGFNHKNSVFVQTKYLAISQLFSGSVVQIMKHTTKVQRPIGGKISFPSGHTSTAFAGATVLFLEFKDTESLLAYSGFVFATATGVLRMTNQKHWLSDVLVGAGIGILSTNMVYHFKPLKNFQPFKKRESITIIPVIAPDSFNIICRF